MSYGLIANNHLASWNSLGLLTTSEIITTSKNIEAQDEDELCEREW